MNTQPQWLRDVVMGLAEGPTCEAVIERGRYAVIKLPGGTLYQAIGSRQRYYPVQFVLVEKGVNHWHGLWKTVWTGRLTKEGRHALEAALELVEGDGVEPAT